MSYAKEFRKELTGQKKHGEPPAKAGGQSNVKEIWLPLGGVQRQHPGARVLHTSGTGDTIHLLKIMRQKGGRLQRGGIAEITRSRKPSRGPFRKAAKQKKKGPIYRGRRKVTSFVLSRRAIKKPRKKASGTNKMLGWGGGSKIFDLKNTVGSGRTENPSKNKGREQRRSGKNSQRIDHKLSRHVHSVN